MKEEEEEEEIGVRGRENTLCEQRRRWNIFPYDLFMFFICVLFIYFLTNKVDACLPLIGYDSCVEKSKGSERE